MLEPKADRLTFAVPTSWRIAVDRCAAASFTSPSELMRQALIRDLTAKGFAPAPPRHEEAAYD
jgi:hypothetical protein